MMMMMMMMVVFNRLNKPKPPAHLELPWCWRGRVGGVFSTLTRSM